MMKTILKKRNPAFVKGENRVRDTSQKAFTVIEAHIESSLMCAEVVDRRQGAGLLVCLCFVYLKNALMHFSGH